MQSGNLFEDPVFKPQGSSLDIGHQNQDSLIKWVRASDLVEDPKFVVNGFDRFDVNQGGLGNCWMLASLANLTMKTKLFEKVVPPKQNFEKEEYSGKWK